MAAFVLAVEAVEAVVAVLRLVARFLLSCGPRDTHLVTQNLLRVGDSRVSGGVVLGMVVEVRSPFPRDPLSTTPF